MYFGSLIDYFFLFISLWMRRINNNYEFLLVIFFILFFFNFFLGEKKIF